MDVGGQPSVKSELHYQHGDHLHVGSEMDIRKEIAREN